MIHDRCRRIAVFLLFFHLLLRTLSAQQPFIRHYSVTEGLPGNEVYDVFQDSGGFLWFATDAGVSRFDGYSFRNFTSRDGLPDNTIFGFYEDHHGRLWFRSYNGLLSYYNGSRIICPPVNAELKKRMPGNFIQTIYVDRGDTVWLGIRGELGMLRVLPGFAALLPSQELEEHLVREMAPGQYLVSSCTFPRASMHPLFFPYGSQIPLVLDGSVDAGSIYCARLSTGTTLINFGEKHYSVKNGKATEKANPLRVIRYVPSKRNRYWACFAGQKGIALMEESDGGDRLVRRLLEGYSVSDCIEDHEGGIWFTTLEKGVFYMPYPEVDEFADNRLAPGEKIASMIAFGDRLVALTSAGGLFCPDSAGWAPGQTTGPLYAFSLFSCGNSLAVAASPQSQLLLPGSDRVTMIRDSTGPVPLVALAEYNADEILGVSMRFVYRINVRTGEAHILGSALPERMRSICKGRGDTIWLGGLSGLWRFVPGQPPVSMHSLDPRLGQRIDFILYDPAKDRLWMSSKGDGLLMKEGSRVISFNRHRPAIPATCRALSLDEAGNTWVATNAGAFCITEVAPGKFYTREFSVRNGLSTNDIISIRCKGDTVWMAASDRIIRFRPENYPHNSTPPPLMLRRIVVDGRTIDPWPAGDCYEFNYGDNAITFSFIALSYKSFGQVHYRFRLAGADSSWHESQSSEAIFYRLQPGEYRFCLYAYNNDGICQAHPLEYCFTVLPPFWQRGWFLLSIALLVLLAAFLFIRFRIRRIRKKEIVNRRLIEMEMTALRAQMSPHFIFNAINSIHNYVLRGDRNASAAYLSKFARLIRNVLENSAQKQIPLAKELETLQLYIEIERMRFSDDFDFVIETDPSLNLSKVMVIPLLLQPYVENAIWHGLLHKKSKGRLVVSITDAGNMLRCVIEDDGVGRAQAALYKQQRNTGSHSMGGEISLRRLNLLNSLYGTRFSLTCTDKKNADGSPAGTRVELLVPKVFKTDNA